MTLKPAHSPEEPTSFAITSINSAVLLSNISAAFNKTLRRSVGPVLDQDLNASCATSAALFASATLAAAADVTTSPSVWL